MTGNSLPYLSQVCSGAFESGHWTPGLGDPSRLGVATVAGYLLTSGLCFWAAARSARAHSRNRIDKPQVFWGCLGLVMLLLAVNKQLDLQMWFWQTGKTFAKTHDLYTYRRAIQWASFGGITAFAVVLFVYLIGMRKQRDWVQALALLGLLYTLCFVLLRASSLHHIDLLLTQTIVGIKINVILELTGITLVAIAGLLALHRTPPRHYTKFADAQPDSGTRGEQG